MYTNFLHVIIALLVMLIMVIALHVILDRKESVKYRVSLKESEKQVEASSRLLFELNISLNKMKLDIIKYETIIEVQSVMLKQVAPEAKSVSASTNVNTFKQSGE